VDGGNGQLGPGVEGTGSLAGVPGTNQVEFARGHNPLDEPVGLRLDLLLVLAVGFLLALLPHQPGQDDRFPCPTPGRFHGVKEIAGALDLVGSGLDLDGWFGFTGGLAVVKPAVAFSLAPGLEVEARVHQPELLAVGQHAEPLAGASQQFEHLGVFRAAPPPADLRRRVCHDEQSRRLAGFVREDDPMRTDGVRPAADADRDRELFRDVVLLGESRSRVAQQIFENGIHESQDGGLVALVVGWVSDPSPGPIGLGLRFGGEASVGVPELAQGGE